MSLVCNGVQRWCATMLLRQPGHLTSASSSLDAVQHPVLPILLVISTSHSKCNYRCNASVAVQHPLSSQHQPSKPLRAQSNAPCQPSTTCTSQPQRTTHHTHMTRKATTTRTRGHMDGAQQPHNSRQVSERLPDLSAPQGVHGGHGGHGHVLRHSCEGSVRDVDGQCRAKSSAVQSL